MSIKCRIFNICFFGIALITFFVLFKEYSFAQSSGEKAKKKLYISTVKASGVPAATANRVKEGIRLTIFESYGNQYHVFDDDAIKVMYKQAEVILSSGCDDQSCITQIADGINADEIVYGDVSQEGAKVAINLTNLERKGISLSTKSIVKISFFESQLDYAASETAKKLIDPQYKIDITKAPVTQDIKLGGIEIQAVKGIDISVIQFKSEDETVEKIVNFSKDIATEGDEYFNKQKYIKARDKYLEIIERIHTKLSKDKQAKVKEYVDEIINRIDSTYILEFKPEIEKVDNWLKGIKEPEETDFEKALVKYSSLEVEIKKIPEPYNTSREQLLFALYERNDSVQIAILSGYEKKADIYYRDYKFVEAMDWYIKSKNKAEKITNLGRKIENSEKILKKVDITLKTGQGYLVNRIKSLVDQAEFYNFQDKAMKARSTMKEASGLLTSSMRIFTTPICFETYNKYAVVIGLEKLYSDEEIKEAKMKEKEKEEERKRAEDVKRQKANEEMKSCLSSRSCVSLFGITVSATSLIILLIFLF